MKRRIASATLALGMVMGVSLLAQGFGIRTGSWSFTMTVKGDMPMEGIPPEMAAQIAAEMAKPRVTTSCVTAENLKDLNLGKMEEDGDEDCKTVSSKITATSADITRECAGDDPGTEISHFEALTPESMKGTITKKTAKGTMTMNMSGKWVGAKCTD